MSSQIQSYLLGEDGFWVAQLTCGHRQHLRHKPPWEVRPWVMTDQGRKQYVGTVIECSDCARGVEIPKAHAVRPADPAEMESVYLMGKDVWAATLSEVDYVGSADSFRRSHRDDHFQTVAWYKSAANHAGRSGTARPIDVRFQAQSFETRSKRLRPQTTPSVATDFG